MLRISTAAALHLPWPSERSGQFVKNRSADVDRRLPRDASFHHMLAEPLLRASKLFEDARATKLEFSLLRLHPSTYHIGAVALLAGKPLHVEARLEPDSHDRRAVFHHRHGDSTINPR
jgi:hypothetical protein